MKTYEEQIGKVKYKVEEFNDVLELNKVNNSREVNETWKPYVISDNEISKDSEFYSVSSKSEAYKLLSEGWTDGVKRIDCDVKKIEKALNVVKTQFYNDVHGFTPVVPLSLMNIPTSMINSKRVNIKTKVVSIVYDFCGSSRESADTLMEAGLEIIKVLLTLESKGYRVNFKVARCNYDDSSKEVNCMVVKLKDAKQPLNLKKIMFPIANPAWFRVVSWDWQDRTPLTAKHYISGRGASFYIAEERGDVKSSDVNKVMGENTYYFNLTSAKKGAEYILQSMQIK